MTGWLFYIGIIRMLKSDTTFLLSTKIMLFSTCNRYILSVFRKRGQDCRIFVKCNEKLLLPVMLCTSQSD